MSLYIQADLKLADVLDSRDNPAIAELERQHEAAIARMARLERIDAVKHQIRAVKESTRGFVIGENHVSPGEFPARRLQPAPGSEKVSSDFLRGALLDVLSKQLAAECKALNDEVAKEVAR